MKRTAGSGSGGSSPAHGRNARHGLARLVFAGVIATTGGRFGRRAAMRGLLSAATGTMAAKLLSAHGPRWAGLRATPPPELVAAAAMAVGGAMELPLTALPLGGLAVLAGTTGRGSTPPAGLLSGAVLGTAAAVGTRRFWPVAPRDGAELSPVRAPVGSRPSPTGKGLVVVLNPGAGDRPDGDLAGTLRVALPDARIVACEEGADLAAVLRDAADGALALGMAGGDGSLNAAAEVAYDLDLPLMAIPAGTLNHLARDLGLDSVDQAIEAVHGGDLVAMDVAVIDDKPFLNTASFGSYAELVDAREQLEDRLGKWPALVVALVRVLRHSEPIPVEIDGRPFPLWMIFVGNCRYHPAGFAPTWRERLDDGRLDVRLVSGEQPWPGPDSCWPSSPAGSAGAACTSNAPPTASTSGRRKALFGSLGTGRPSTAPETSR